VKIYENLESLPRVFIVHRAWILEDALEAMKEEAFDPGQEVILSQGPGAILRRGRPKTGSPWLVISQRGWRFRLI